MYALSVSQDDLTTPLRSFLIEASGVDADNVILGQQNRASMPNGDFIVMTPLSQIGLSTNKVLYDDNGVYGEGKQLNGRSTQWSCQIDCYGENAAQVAAILGGVIRSSHACEWFRGNGNILAPMYCSEPKQTFMVNGEQQYEDRWTLDFVAQYNPTVTTPRDFMDNVKVGVIPADIFYPTENG